MTLSSKLAKWVCTVQRDTLPRPIMTAAKLQLLDMVGAMLAGRDDPVCAKLRQAQLDEDRGSGCWIVGLAGQAAPRPAAMLQAVMSSVLEFDDSHVATGIHIGGPVVGAALALGQRRHVGGEALLRAIAVGAELGCRLGLVAPGKFHRLGLHPTAMVGAFGATYALSTLLDFQARQIEDAAGISGSFTAGIMASWADGSAAKTLHAGWSAVAGLEAVRCAAAGISGPAGVYEGRFGFFPSHVQEPGFEFDLGAASEALGTRWEILSIASRPYPCGHYIQPFLDACAEALQAAPNKLIEDIEAIVCFAADYMVPLIAEPHSEKLAPLTPWHARYSLQICIAELILTGRFDKSSLTPDSIHDVRLRALAAKVTYEVDGAAVDRRKWSGDVQIRFKDGTAVRRRIEHLRGTPGNPMSEVEYLNKFRANARGVLPDAQIERSIEVLMDIQRSPDITSAFATLSAPEPAC